MQYNKSKRVSTLRTELLIHCVESQINHLQQTTDDAFTSIFNLMNINQLRVLLWELEVEHQHNSNGIARMFTPSFEKNYLHQN